MKTYAEFLRENGASDEDIKILDTPVARKVYEQQMTALEAATTLAAKNKADLDNYNAWYNDKALPAYTEMEKALIIARGNEAKAREIIKTAGEQGLIDIAKAAGFEVEVDDKNKNKNNEPPPIDTSKFVTQDLLIATAQKEGDAIAIAQDIAAEHVYLFGKPLRNFRELRKEALERKVSVEQVWQEKYGVVKARSDKEAADRKAEEDKIRADERNKVTAEFADKYGSPDQRPPVVSTNILTPRPDHGRAKQPWETGTDGENGSNSRVQRALKDNVRATN